MENLILMKIQSSVLTWTWILDFDLGFVKTSAWVTLNQFCSYQNKKDIFCWILVQKYNIRFIFLNSCKWVWMNIINLANYWKIQDLWHFIASWRFCGSQPKYTVSLQSINLILWNVSILNKFYNMCTYMGDQSKQTRLKVVPFLEFSSDQKFLRTNRLIEWVIEATSHRLKITSWTNAFCMQQKNAA